MHRTFSEKPFNERYELMGDTAEHRFRVWAAEEYMPYTDYGLRRPQVPVYKLPAFIRYTPDFLLGDALVEVQGCGRDQTIKMKHDKLWALETWDIHCGVYVWMWNQSNDQIGVMTFNVFQDLCSDMTGCYREDGMFDETKPYTTVSWNDFYSHEYCLRTKDDWDNLRHHVA